MRILFVCNKLPYPPVEGSPIAMNALISGLLEQGHELKVLAVESSKFNFDSNKIPGEYIRRTRLESVYLDLDIKPLALLKDLWKGQSYHVSRFYSRNFEQKLRTVLQCEDFDIVQLETLYMGPYIPVIRELSKARIILRAHNIEHLIWFHLARESFNPLRKLLLHRLSETLRRYEEKIREKVDGIACISPDDARYYNKLSGNAPVILIPFGINDEVNENPGQSLAPLSLFHIGSMNWIPNEQGIKWFLKEVWPEIHHRYPDICLNLAGRQMPNWLKFHSQEGVFIAGEVPDAWEFMAQNRIMIVPLFSGSGIRIKIIQGMLAEKAIVTTQTGASGIAYKNGVHLMIADDRESFIKALIHLIENPELCKQLGKQAHQLAVSDHNNPRIIEKLTGFYHRLLS